MQTKASEARWNTSNKLGLDLSTRIHAGINFRDFYFPNALFNNNVSLISPNKCKFSGVVYSSELYQKKYEALRIPVTCNKGKPFGKGLVKEI
jgi:hypothetical protein